MLAQASEGLAFNVNSQQQHVFQNWHCTVGGNELVFERICTLGDTSTPFFQKYLHTLQSKSHDKINNKLIKRAEAVI